MEKFNIKKMYGYYWMIISIIVPLICFIIYLSITIYLKINYDKAYSKDNANFVLIVLTCINIFLALFCIGKLASYLYLLLPFKNSKGEIITVEVTERSMFATMHGVVKTKNGNKEVKVILMSGGIKFLSDYNVGDYVDCFIREKDLSNPKYVVLYK